MATGYVAVKFNKGDEKLYTFIAPKWSVEVGDTVIVDTINGEKQVEVVAVYDGYASDDAELRAFIMKMSGVKEFKRVLRKVKFTELEYEEE